MEVDLKYVVECFIEDNMVSAQTRLVQGSIWHDIVLFFQQNDIDYQTKFITIDNRIVRVDLIWINKNKLERTYWYEI